MQNNSWKQKKGEPVFAFECAMVGDDGLEPPTYAV
jgi:hypothetical protein